MRGHTAKTPENVARARELRAKGALLKDIAADIGVHVTTVQGWLDDPDGVKARARKNSYRQPCPQCGEPMNGSNGPHNLPDRCMACTKIWTEQAIITAIQRWVTEHGQPPLSLDWSSATPDWCPVAESVRRAFGSFTAGIIAAGFEPRRTRDRHRFAALDIDAVCDRIRAGEPLAQIAQEFATCAETLNTALNWRGVLISELRERACRQQQSSRVALAARAVVSLGISQTEAARHFGVHQSSVSKALSRSRRILDAA